MQTIRQHISENFQGCKNLKNLNLNREHDRLKSFEGYVNSQKLNIGLMALLGLFYNSQCKEVVCYFCKNMFQFKSNDEIIPLHYKYSRSCPLMTRRHTSNEPIDMEKLDLTLPPLIYDECGTGYRYTNASPIYREIKYPHFSKLEDRKNSYAGWPLQMKQTPEVLAESGLFYTKEGDKVKCYDCGLGLKDWEETDDPWIEHGKYNPKCHYMNFVKGKEFLERVKSKQLGELKDNRNEQESKLLYENNECQKCHKGLAEVNFLPCNHTSLCAICAISTNECLTCRTTVQCRLRLYY